MHTVQHAIARDSRRPHQAGAAHAQCAHLLAERAAEMGAVSVVDSNQIPGGSGGVIHPPVLEAVERWQQWKQC